MNQLSPEESLGLKGSGQNLPLGGDDQDPIALRQVRKIVFFFVHFDASPRLVKQSKQIHALRRFKKGEGLVYILHYQIDNNLSCKL